MAARLRDDVQRRARFEVVEVAELVYSTVHEIALPRPRVPALEVAGISGAREVENALRGHVVHCLRDGPVLEWAFVRVGDVVDDHLAPIRLQASDVLRHLRRTT